MPELPEVETVMRGLRMRLEGRRLVRAVANRPDMRWPLPLALVDTLVGARTIGFRRRGKYILMRLDSGWSVLLHLGMSGRMVVGRVGKNAVTLHEHLEMETDDGWRVGFVDPRRFGSVDLIETAHEDDHRLLAEIGPEPLDDAFTVTVLEAALAGKKTPIKAALLDQKVVAGLGNIYVCESLFRAGNQADADRGDCRGRIVVAGLRPAGRRVGLFPARVEGVRAGRRTLPRLSGRAGLRRRAPDCAVGAQHVLLPSDTAVARGLGAVALTAG
jgi:DNA-formamidopyrimidine glycosylase